MAARLVVQPTRGEAFEVNIGSVATIGRTHENTVCLSFSPLVSRQHAVIRLQSGFQYYLIDLGSHNGTYVHDQRVVMPIPLSTGARIRIADNIITFTCSADTQKPDYLEATLTDANPASEIATRPAALLVCDIRGFSTIAERTRPDEVARTLGAWFRDSSNLVANRGGIVDKFIGDAIFAYWHGTADVEDCRAAIATARLLLDLAIARSWPDGTSLRVTIALHYGQVTYIALGHAGERDMTIIGDAVNTVFRLETLSKELNQPLILSGEFCARVATGGTFVALGAHLLKGKADQITVFGVKTT